MYATTTAPTTPATTHLIGVDWTLGVTASSSELQAVGSTFVVLRLHVEDEDGAARYEHLELTVERFYELRHQLEAAKTQMELA